VKLYYTNLVENIHWARLLWNSSMNSLIWLYMFMCIYVVGSYICLCAYTLLVVIYVMCIYVVGDYICLCAYMLLVNFSYMLLVVKCWVSMYWIMLVWICGIRMKYVLLLSSPRSAHSCCWISSPCLVANTFVFNYAGWLWCSVGIRGDGLEDEIGTTRI